MPEGVHAQRVLSGGGATTSSLRLDAGQDGSLIRSGWREDAKSPDAVSWVTVPRRLLNRIRQATVASGGRE